VVPKYKDLSLLILNEGIQSINLSVFIVKSFLFKNSIFIICFILMEYIVYQGDYYVLGLEYVGLIYFIYNLFSSLPLIYCVLYRPEAIKELVKRGVDENKHTVFLSLDLLCEELIMVSVTVFLVSIINLSFLVSTFMENMFFSVLMSCFTATILYQLSIGTFINK
jgi:hypothetical protein